MKAQQRGAKFGAEWSASRQRTVWLDVLPTPWWVDASKYPGEKKPRRERRIQRRQDRSITKRNESMPYFFERLCEVMTAASGDLAAAMDRMFETVKSASINIDKLREQAEQLAVVSGVPVAEVESYREARRAAVMASALTAVVA